MSGKREQGDACTTRKMTPKEMAETERQLLKEKERYAISLQIGGVDERGNYTALHHRWEEKQ